MGERALTAEERAQVAEQKAKAIQGLKEIIQILEGGAEDEFTLITIFRNAQANYGFGLCTQPEAISRQVVVGELENLKFNLLLNAALPNHLKAFFDEDSTYNEEADDAE